MFVSNLLKLTFIYLTTEFFFKISLQNISSSLPLTLNKVRMIIPIPLSLVVKENTHLTNASSFNEIFSPISNMKLLQQSNAK